MVRGQAIRRSQFVLTYGVGSILEAPNGPRIILDFERWGRISSSLLSRFEIQDANVSALLNGGRIFALPTNADMQVPDDQILFRTGRFPRWALCQDDRILYELTPSGTTRCPDCTLGRGEAQDQAIRFVRACPRGHLDDVDWRRIIHRNQRGCNGALFTWEERGSTLDDITIICRECGARATLRVIYYGTYTCSGRFPESGIHESCDERASVILRNASNLRIPELVSALTIPPRITSLHRLLENPQILAIVASERSWTKDELLTRLRTASRRIPSINPISIAEIENALEVELLSAIEDVIQPPEPDLIPEDVRNREFEELQNAAIHGTPPNPYFEVDESAVITTPLPSGLSLRVTPVKRLRVVIAQRGYRRPIRGPTSVVVPTFYTEGQEQWYVGVEIHGEGIFIDFPPRNMLDLQELEPAEAWGREFERTRHYKFHPVFVWWHTLSHRLIGALSIDSGYSSTSIRERVYVRMNGGSERTNGGVLVYTSQPGGDGSFGGLIALVPEFHRVISAALGNLNSCSNDPLCSEQTFAPGRINGATCYVCLFLSETSCEFGNAFLDRNLLRLSI